MVPFREKDRADLCQPLHQRQTVFHPVRARAIVFLSAFKRLFVVPVNLSVHDQVSADDHCIRGKLFYLLNQFFIVLSVGLFVKIGYKYQFDRFFYP